MKAAELKRLKKAAIKTIATVVAESFNELEKAIHSSLVSLLQQPVSAKSRKARTDRKPKVKAERKVRTFKQPVTVTTTVVDD